MYLYFSMLCALIIFPVFNLYTLIILIFLQHYPIQQAPARGVVEILGCQILWGRATAVLLQVQ